MVDVRRIPLCAAALLCRLPQGGSKAPPPRNIRLGVVRRPSSRQSVYSVLPPLLHSGAIWLRLPDFELCGFGAKRTDEPGKCTERDGYATARKQGSQGAGAIC